MPTFKTLGELTSRLRTRLGYSSIGASAGVQDAILKSFLFDAQALLYSIHNWAHRRYYHTDTIGTNQYLLDYPTEADGAPKDADPDRVLAISVLRSDVWSPALKKGIPPELYTTQDMYSWPQRWEPYSQIEFWPKTDQNYSIRIFYLAKMDAFAADSDRASIDDNMIFLLALGYAKSHYRHPDAEVWVKQGEVLVNSLRARSWGKTEFSPYDGSDEPLVKPVVV